MKIAVTYENGNVFQHFGRTQFFKIYEISDGRVLDTEVIDCGGYGHEALAQYLKSKGADMLICGGMGPGAEAALAEAGIAVFSGAQGSADEAVSLFLSGGMTPGGANCDHHDEGCAGECEGDCGSGCPGCGPQIIMEGANAGRTVSVHYRGTFNDGTQFDSSYDRGQPLQFVSGTGMMIRGFDQAVVNMKQGEKVTIHLMPEEAYGNYDEDAVFSVDIAALPGSESLEAGQQVYLQTASGYPMRVKVKEKTDDTITFDANHEMAGKELNFEIELLTVE